jgi:glycosyltransferase involved in cell wall biosynthesis
MKVLFISKYPPIEGGVASRNYWLTRALGARGIEVSIVTNALTVEEMWREDLGQSGHEVSKDFQPPHVRVHSLKSEAPAHIPYSPAYLSRLVSLGLKVLGEHGGDVIDTHYLEPYGAAGFIIKKITGLPLIVRHAGSDIYRLLQNPDFRYFLGRVIQEADCLFFSRSLMPLIRSLGVDEKKRATFSHGALDDSAFTPDGEKFDFAQNNIIVPSGIPILTYMGKAGPYKGIQETIRALAGIKRDFRFLMVANGRKMEEYQAEIASHNLEEKVINIGFVAPWIIPSILRASTALLHLENNFPIPIHRPVQPFEAIATRTPLVLSREMHEKIKPRFPDNAEHFKVVENVSDIGELQKALLYALDTPDVLEDHAERLRAEFLEGNDWKGYIDSYAGMYDALARHKKIQ